MTEMKCEEIKTYLSAKFPGCDIEQKPDFDLGAQSFKLHVADSTLLLKVSDELIADNDIVKIIGLFDSWALVDHLQKGQGVIVTQHGLKSFERC